MDARQHSDPRDAEAMRETATAEPLTDPDLAEDGGGEEDGEEAGLYEHFAVTADKGQTPMRLDKFLTMRMEHCSRNRIQAAADSGNILTASRSCCPTRGARRSSFPKRSPW